MLAALERSQGKAWTQIGDGHGDGTKRMSSVNEWQTEGGEPSSIELGIYAG